MCDPRRFSRALSAFDHAAHRWAAVPLRPLAPSDSSTAAPSSFWPADRRIVGEQLTLTSWNIQAVQSKRAERSRRLLDCILDAPGLKSPDIIFLQEVASDVRQSVLDDPRVRARFLTTDAEDDTAFTHLPAFATMTLLSSERFASPSLAEEHGSNGATQAVEERGPKILLESAFRMTLPSRELKDALCVDVRAPARPGQILRLLNAQLDSHESPFRRATQVRLLDSLLRERGCGGGVISGDLIAPKLVERYGLIDARAKLQVRVGSTEGRSGVATRNVGGGLWNPRWPHRLGNVVMLCLEPSEIEVLEPSRVDAGPFWSDHCGLRCTFAV